MKKYLLITLAFLVVLSMTLTSCNTNEDVSKTPSDISEPQSNIPSETESDIPSNTPSQDVSTDLTEEDILKDKTVLYYTGEHYTHLGHELIPLGIEEEYSGNNPVMGYIEINSVESDTYFLVAIESMKNRTVDYGDPMNFDLIDEDNREFLNEIGMVMCDSHPMLINPEAVLDPSFDVDERREYFTKKWKAILPDFDASKYTKDELEKIPEFRYVGYITAEGLKKLDSYKDYSIYLTWLNSPDNYEVWENSIHH